MGKRRSSRELAIRFLYLTEMNAGEWQQQLEQFWERNPCQEDIRAYTEELVGYVFEHRPEIDALVARFSDHWTLERMGVIDRNLLRLAVAEIQYSENVPAPVAINEAVEIAKRYGTDESPQFINAVLDQIRKQAEADRVTKTPAE